MSGAVNIREHQRRAAAARDVAGWSSECLESEKKFGHRAARLYPLISHKQKADGRVTNQNAVRTPAGIGTLVQVFSDRCLVLLLKTKEVTVEMGKKTHRYRPLMPFAVEEITPYRKGAR